MQYLLDTHTFLWMAADPANLSRKVRRIVLKESNRLYLSAVSGWEIALLHLFRVTVELGSVSYVPA